MTSPQQNIDTVQSNHRSMKAVVCQSCGVNNSISESEAGECEFCGSMIKQDLSIKMINRKI
ncbi:hypothetical protein [Marinisporobacter balticus]|uniref:Uncharacterized protein n=1 Tax=Marinisporobacter balticus TaxID=2018667 RepID=A0A4V2SCI9_9FIRM|nr:hypothetical protein [Marinisporobacter balticus]TCO79530.1 hypothetical protein EV214_102255 [Marinisporobacter balticus]